MGEVTALTGSVSREPLGLFPISLGQCGGETLLWSPWLKTLIIMAASRLVVAVLCWVQGGMHFLIALSDTSQGSNCGDCKAAGVAGRWGRGCPRQLSPLSQGANTLININILHASLTTPCCCRCRWLSKILLILLIVICLCCFNALCTL